MNTYVGGTFDLFHHGHVNLLQRAARFGPVTVALNTDAFVERYKRRRPVMALEERFAVVDACMFVKDVVVNHGGEDSRESILGANTDLIVHGDDWTGDGYLRQLGIDRDFLATHDIGLVFLPYTRGVSTSEIIARCRPYMEWR